MLDWPDPALTDLLELFPNLPFRHRMRFQPGSLGQFFGRSAEHVALLEARRFWLGQDPTAYAGLTPEGLEPLVEMIELMTAAGVLGADFSAPRPTDPIPTVLALGQRLEPDWMLLVPEGAAFRLVAGCVCFPSSWSFAKKLGQPLEWIHDSVPELNSQIGKAIQAYLTRLEPGDVTLRSNWGLSRSADWNQHPSRQLPRLDPTTELSEVWMRVEHQLLTRLPRSNAILFGIRLSNHALQDLRSAPQLCQRVRLAFETMPESVATYKNLAMARHRLLELLT